MSRWPSGQPGPTGSPALADLKVTWADLKVGATRGVVPTEKISEVNVCLAAGTRCAAD